MVSDPHVVLLLSLLGTPNDVYKHPVHLQAAIKVVKLVTSQQKAWKPGLKQSTVACRE